MAQLNKIKILEESKEYKWDEFVLTNSQGTIYHTSAWKNIIQDTYGHLPMYLYTEDSEGVIKSCLPMFNVKSKFTPNRLVCLPCSQFCNPIISCKDDYCSLINYSKYIKSKNKIKYIELRLNEKNNHLLNGEKYRKDYYSTFVLDLEPDLNEIYKNFHKSCVQRILNKIKKNNDMTIEINKSNKCIEDFYKLYIGMRKKSLLIPQPYEFFENIWKNLKSNGNVEVHLAIHQNKVVSALLMLLYKKTVTYEYGGSVYEKMHLHPSHYLLWNAIKRYKNLGYTKFDFGRTSSSNIGLYNFKKRWGTKRDKITYYSIGNDEEKKHLRHNIFIKKLMNYALKYTPLVFDRFVGSLLYKEII